MSCQWDGAGRGSGSGGNGKLSSALLMAYMKMIMNYFMACLNAFMSFVPGNKTNTQTT